MWSIGQEYVLGVVNGEQKQNKYLVGIRGWCGQMIIRNTTDVNRYLAEIGGG